MTVFTSVPDSLAGELGKLQQPRPAYAALIEEGRVDLRRYVPAGRYAVVLTSVNENAMAREFDLARAELVVGETALSAKASFYLLASEDDYLQMSGGDILVPGRYEVRYVPPGAILEAQHPLSYPQNRWAPLGCVTLEG